MRYGISGRLCAFLSVFFLWLSIANATSVPSLSFEELTSQSELIVSGQIARSWTDWDSEHKYIWTHYELGVSSALKGNPGATVVISEPGGVVGLQAMSVAGAPVYQTGEQVVVFLQRVPNGYLRTTGWSQGKFATDKAGLLHGQGAGGAELVDTKGPQRATPLRSLNGMSVAQLRAMIAARTQGGNR